MAETSCTDDFHRSILSSPFCFACGYDLRGLELPRPCPECGRLSDPAADAAEVRRWFAGRLTPVTWLFRPRRIPAGLWYTLSDDTSARLARRRAFYGLWLPAILTALVVGTGAFVTVDYDVKVWYYASKDPERTPLRVVNEQESDRLYAVNLHLFRGGFFFNKPTSWVEVVERKRKDYGFNTPEYFDDMFLLWGVSPFLAVLFGFVPARAILLWHVRRESPLRDRPEIRRMARATFSLMAGLFGLALWLWLGAVILYGLIDLVPICEEAMSVVGGMLLGSIALWGLVACVGYPVLVSRERGRRLFRWRLPLCVAFVVATVGGPPMAFWGLLKICE